jgi:hypothetical protein
VAEVDWKEKTDDKSFVLTCYGASEVKFEDMDDQEGCDVGSITRLAAEAIVNEKLFETETEPNDEDPQILRSKAKTDFGYHLFVI